MDTSTVTRTGKLFELGDYPDKEFSITEDEADAAVAAFGGVPLNIEHSPSILDGKLGAVTRLWREGTAILAEFVIPRWLHEVTHAAPLKVSSEWDRATQQITGAALVLAPRVRDAAIMAAFAACAPGGPEDRDSNMDTAAEGPIVRTRGFSGFSPRRKEGNTVNLFTRLAALFKSAAEEADGECAAPEVAASAAGADSIGGTVRDGVAAAQSEADALRSEIAAMRYASLQRDAADWADSEVAAGRAFPPERDPMVAAFMQSAADDASAHPTVEFGGGPSISRVAALKALFSLRLPHNLLTELLKPGTAEGYEAQALFSRLTTADPGIEKPPTPDRLRQLKEMTPLGQADLKAQAARTP